MAHDPTENAPALVIGIGASAGGLDALRELVRRLPARNGAAIVVVVHLAPDHESHLADLLQVHAAMPVLQVSQDTPLEADHIYVIPPNRKLSAIDSHLRLTPLGENPTSRHLIDHFFRTLAKVHDGHSVGVVLSGTGSDGTIGLAKIRACGGLTIAQDPSEAEYGDMPRNAILADTVDLVLPIAEIAERLVELAARAPENLSEVVADDSAARSGTPLADILATVHERTGHDFSGYKQATIVRRIQRRLQIHRVTELADYLAVLEDAPDEIDLLFNDLLIPVTYFFRDPDTFEALRVDLLPKIFEGKGRGDSIRVWSVGCSTGEEPYSIAILLLEYLATLSDRPQIQIFASDLHDASLKRARRGVYPASIESDVSAERLERYFDEAGSGYSVADAVRSLVVFAHHDLLSDPPFSRMDLVSCRNMLIYLDSDAQRQALGTLHYALNPGGALVLGASETAERSEMFTTVDKRHAFFRRRELGVRRAPMSTLRRRPPRPDVGSDLPPINDGGYDQLHRSLLERYGPPSLLVDASNRIVHFSSGVGRFLIHPDGPPTDDVFQLLDERLRIELRSAVFTARRDRDAVVGSATTLVVGQAETTVVLRVVPISDHDLILVIFDELSARGSSGATNPLVDDATVVGLTAQLDEANRRLDSVISEYESGQDDMKAANEELQSTNEELRSTMEELETSKEELQSTNEELSTVNQENRHRVEELAMLSSDLHNLLTATDIATLFLDRQLRIVRFTPPVTQIFNIVLDDRGRAITDFTDRLRGHELARDAQEVLDRLIPIEYELLSDDDRWLLTRILPYRTSDDRIEGVVVTFVDITRRHRAEADLRSSEHGLRLALDAAAMGTWWWDPVADLSGGDRRAFEILGAVPDDGSFVDLVADHLEVDDRSRWLTFVRSGDDQDLELRAVLASGETVDLQVNVGDDERGAGDDERLHPIRRGTIRDVTARVVAMRSLAERTRRLALLTEAAAHLLRGTGPDEVIEQLFDQVSEVLGLEIYERYEFTDREGPRAVGGNVEWMSPGTGEDGGDVIGLHACAVVSERHEPVIFDELRDLPPRELAVARREGILSYGCFPLLDGVEVSGALCFGTRGSAGFDEATVEFIRTIVDYLVVGEQRLRAESQLRELNRTLETRIDEATRDLQASEAQLRRLASNLVGAEQSERQRIAQLLHDDVQQLLFGAQMRLGLLRDNIDPDELDQLVTHLDEAERYLKEGIDTTRLLSAELAPPSLDDEDVGATVRWLVEQMRELHGLEVEVRVLDELLVPHRETRVIVHQTLRELLFNVVKHAGVDHATVDLSIVDGELSIHVGDRGSGFDTDEVFADPAGDKRGLSTLRQRLSLVGGALSIESITGDGTRARVQLPAREIGPR